MKPNHYRVIFATGCCQEVKAFNRQEAAILAQAKEIQAGREYGVHEIWVRHDKVHNTWKRVEAESKPNGKVE